MTYSTSWTLLFLARNERKAKVRARRLGKYNAVTWNYRG